MDLECTPGNAIKVICNLCEHVAKDPSLSPAAVDAFMAVTSKLLAELVIEAESLASMDGAPKHKSL